MAARLDPHRRLAAELASLDDADFADVLTHGPAQRAGWGVSYPATVGNLPVFVKRVPVTDVEMAHPRSTRNHYGLPLFYSYGVGSAGFGVFRELALYERTTGWVLAGETQAFPVLYHARVLPGRYPVPDQRFDLDSYVASWNGDQAIRRYVEARHAASSELWLVLEHFPFTLGSWLPDNLGHVDAVLDDLLGAITVLRRHGVVHFDAHLANVVGDGTRACLTDFGLGLDGAFELTEEERSFLARHRHYDYGEVLLSVGAAAAGLFWRLPDDQRDRLKAKYGLPPRPGLDDLLTTLVENVGELHASGDLPLDAAYVETVRRYRDVMLFMVRFHSALRRDPSKQATYDDGALAALLHDAGLGDLPA